MTTGTGSGTIDAVTEESRKLELELGTGIRKGDVGNVVDITKEYMAELETTAFINRGAVETLRRHDNGGDALDF